jgi:hypothetical protein
VGPFNTSFEPGLAPGTRLDEVGPRPTITIEGWFISGARGGM